jgi:hypothetical protein
MQQQFDIFRNFISTSVVLSGWHCEMASEWLQRVQSTVAPVEGEALIEISFAIFPFLIIME